MADDKPPRWLDGPPPGFKPDGTSMIVSSAADLKWPEQKIDLGDGVLITPEDLALALEGDEEEDDLSDLDDIGDLP
jgi:hypothetical protein